MSSKFTTWIKSSDSDPGANCFEASFADDGSGEVAVRDSKLGPGSPVLVFTAGEWDAMLRGMRRGDFDPR